MTRDFSRDYSSQIRSDSDHRGRGMSTNSQPKELGFNKPKLQTPESIFFKGRYYNLLMIQKSPGPRIEVKPEELMVVYEGFATCSSKPDCIEGGDLIFVKYEGFYAPVSGLITLRKMIAEKAVIRGRFLSNPTIARCAI